MQDSNTYRLDEVLSIIKSKYKERQKRISDLKSSIKILKELLNTINRLPRELRPSIRDTIFNTIKEVLENELYVNDIDKAINVLKEAYNEIAKTTVSHLFMSKALLCKDNLSQYHDNIMEMLNIVVNENRSISLTLREVLDEVTEDPCLIFHVFSVEGLYNIDKIISNILENIHKFFNCENEGRLLNMIKDYLMTFKLHQIIGGNVGDLKDISNILTKLLIEYRNHVNILSCIDNITKYSFQTPIMQVLHENISKMLKEAKEEISDYRDRICNLEHELIGFKERLNDYRKTVDNTSRKINERVNDYIKNIKRFLNRIGSPDITRELERLSSTIMTLESVYRILTKIDQVINSSLEKFSVTEREILKKLLSMLSTKPSPELRLDQVIKIIGEEEDKLKALVNICKSGIIKCIIGV